MGSLSQTIKFDSLSNCAFMHNNLLPMSLAALAMASLFANDDGTIQLYNKMHLQSGTNVPILGVMEDNWRRINDAHSLVRHMLQIGRCLQSLEITSSSIGHTKAHAYMDGCGERMKRERIEQTNKHTQTHKHTHTHTRTRIHKHASAIPANPRFPPPPLCLHCPNITTHN